MLFVQLSCLRKILLLFVAVGSSKREIKMFRSSHQMFYVNVSSLLRESDDPLTLAGGEDFLLRWHGQEHDGSQSISRKLLKSKFHSSFMFLATRTLELRLFCQLHWFQFLWNVKDAHFFHFPWILKHFTKSLNTSCWLCSHCSFT